MRATLILAAGALLSCPLAQAQVYKCVDAAGKTIYSQSPCPSGEKSQKLDIKTAPAPAPATPDAKKGGKPPLSPEAAFRKRQTEREEADKKASEAAAQASVKEENCRQARAALAQVESGVRISRLNDKGEREYLGDDQLAQEKARSQGLVAKWCN
jgi:hypothetical protein